MVPLRVVIFRKTAAKVLRGLSITLTGSRRNLHARGHTGGKKAKKTDIPHCSRPAGKTYKNFSHMPASGIPAALTRINLTTTTKDNLVSPDTADGP